MNSYLFGWKDLGFFSIICPIMKLIVKVLHTRLPKAHTCHHHMACKSKLDMLDCSTLGCKVCLFGQSPLLLLLDPKYQLGGGCHRFYWSLCPFQYLSLCTLVNHCCHVLPLVFMMFERGVIVNNELQKMPF